MTADDYGIFNSLNSLVVVIAAPTTVIQLVIARYTAQFNNSIVATFSRKSLKRLSVAVVCLIGVGVLLLPVLRSFLHIQGQFSIIIMLMALGCTIMLSIPLGLLQGLSRFHPYGITNASLSFLRFAFMILLVALIGLGVKGAVLAVLIALITTLIIGFNYLKDIFKIDGTTLPDNFYKNVGVYAIPTFLATAMIMFFLNIDIVLVRHFCEATESGTYAAAAILGHAVFILPGVLMMVLFPEIARAGLQKKQEKNIFLISLTMTTLIALGITIVFNLFPNFVMTLTFGNKYSGPEPANLLSVISFAMISLVITNVIVTYGTAKANFDFLWILSIGIILFIVLVLMRHDSPLHIAKNLLYSTLFILVGMCFWVIPRNKIFTL